MCLKAITFRAVSAYKLKSFKKAIKIRYEADISDNLWLLHD